MGDFWIMGDLWLMNYISRITCFLSSHSQNAELVWLNKHSHHLMLVRSLQVTGGKLSASSNRQSNKRTNKKTNKRPSVAYVGNRTTAGQFGFLSKSPMSQPAQLGPSLDFGLKSLKHPQNSRFFPSKPKCWKPAQCEKKGTLQCKFCQDISI